MRNGIKTAAGWLHTALILAIIIPTLYALPLQYAEYDGGKLYLLALFITLPVIATGIAGKKCRSMILYLAVSFAAAAVTLAMASALGKRMLGGYMWGCVILLAAETVWIVLERFLQRASIDRNAAKKESFNPEYRPRESIPENPNFGFLALFVVSYLVGIFLANPTLCDQAFWSGILYLFAAVLHRYVESTGEYLSLHTRIHGIPSKRIYGISGGILAVILAVLFLIAIAAAALGGHRSYTDLRDMEPILPAQEEQFVQEEWMQMGGGGIDITAQLEGELGESKPVPPWVDDLIEIMGILILLGLLAAAVQMVRMMFRKFRENFEENGDLVEELQEETGAEEKLGKRKAELRFRSERERVRYRYRRFIRKHRRGKPGAYETPHEIETFADVADSEEGKEMHRMYEEARYGGGSRL